MTKISGISATTGTLASTHLVELENGSGNSEKMAADNFAKGLRSLAFTGCLLKKSVDQTLANFSAGANIFWDAEDYDFGGLHSTVSNTDRITFTEAGLWVVGVQVTVGSGTLAASDYVRGFVHRYNSSGVQQSDIGLPNNFINEISAAPGVGVMAMGLPVNVSIGDYVVSQLDTESDASITIVASQSCFGAWRVG